MPQGDRLDWEREGLHWPHRERSRFVTVQSLRWHVQQWPGPHPGAPLALLIHGTGASTHSWRDLAPALQEHFAVLTVDLPGHAFTGTAPGSRQAPPLSLPGMARALSELLRALGLAPELLVGHSAGAAIAVRLCLDGLAHPRLLVGLNAALLPWGGLAGTLFSPVAKLMAFVPLVPRLFARRAQDPAVLDRLLEGTGSTLDATGRALYGQLVGHPAHVAGTLGMMANWDLGTLARDLPRLRTPLDLVVGLRDHTVPPEQAQRVQALLPPSLQARCLPLENLGHLAHEEAPERVAALIEACFAERAPQVPPT